MKGLEREGKGGEDWIVWKFMIKQPYENLIVWQKADEFLYLVYAESSLFPIKKLEYKLSNVSYFLNQTIKSVYGEKTEVE